MLTQNLDIKAWELISKSVKVPYSFEQLLADDIPDNLKVKHAKKDM